MWNSPAACAIALAIAVRCAVGCSTDDGDAPDEVLDATTDATETSDAADPCSELEFDPRTSERCPGLEETVCDFGEASCGFIPERDQTGIQRCWCTPTGDAATPPIWKCEQIGC